MENNQNTQEMNTQNTNKMELLALRVERVEFYRKEDKTDVKIIFEESFKGLKMKDGIVIPEMVNYVSIPLRKLTAQLCEIHEKFAFMRAAKAKALTNSQLSCVLFKADMVIDRELRLKGELDDNNEVLDRDKYYTYVRKLKMSSIGLQACEQLTTHFLLNSEE